MTSPATPPPSKVRLISSNPPVPPIDSSSLRRRDPVGVGVSGDGTMALVRGGVEPTVIALWLGHESIQTTEDYLRVDVTQRIEVDP